MKSEVDVVKVRRRILPQKDNEKISYRKIVFSIGVNLDNKGRNATSSLPFSGFSDVRECIGSENGG